MSITRMASGATKAKRRRRWGWPVVLLCGVGLVWAGWAWWTSRRYHRALLEIQSEIAADRYATACQKLERLASGSADRSGRIAYLLGYCERARGRDDAAQAAWARVAPGSRLARQALEGRMRLFEESGRLAEAERIVNEAASDPRNDRTAMLVLLVPTFREQGRIEEAARLIENRWEHLRALNEGALEPAIRLVRRHIELTLKPESIESLRPALEQASARAPEDDRVWLGLANLAIRTGALDEAKRWLLACRSRRPDDAAVWQALLSWGLAAAHVDIVEEAAAHLPAGERNLPRLHRTRAWLAACRGDLVTERRELDRLIAADPADLTALKRLAELAEQEGEDERAAELRENQTRVNQLLARYLRLHDRRQPVRDAEELAHLAEELGRRFEARVFLTIAISENYQRHTAGVDHE